MLINLLFMTCILLTVVRQQTLSLQGFAEEERVLREKIRGLHTQRQTRDEEYRQKEWRFEDKLKENDVKVQK